MKFKKTVYLGGKSKNNKASSALGGIIIIAFGVLFLVISFFLAKSDKEFKEIALPTTGVITDIEVDYVRRNGKTRKDHDVYVEYVVDGVVYNEKLNYYHSGMYRGQKLTVYYNPEYPYEMRGESSGSGIMTVVSCIFILIGVAVAVPDVLSRGKKKKLMATGEKTEGLITNVYIDRSISYNKRHPYRADCEVTNPVTGEVYLYSSERVMNNIMHLQGRLVDVYYDPNNRGKYYIDLDSAEVNDAADSSSSGVYDYR